MSEAQTPVVENPSSESKETASQTASSDVKQSSKASPASDLRDIQNLLLMGIFPGNVAPAVIKGYQLLEKMAVQVEASLEVK